MQPLRDYAHFHATDTGSVAGQAHVSFFFFSIAFHYFSFYLINFDFCFFFCVCIGVWFTFN